MCRSMLTVAPHHMSSCCARKQSSNLIRSF